MVSSLRKVETGLKFPFLLEFFGASENSRDHSFRCTTLTIQIPIKNVILKGDSAVILAITRSFCGE